MEKKIHLNNLIYFFLLALFIHGCGDQNEKFSDRVIPVASKTENTDQNHPVGKRLLTNKCYNCHSPSADEKNRIAPPMVAVKSFYLHGNPSKFDFENAIWNFVSKPTADHAKMIDAVDRFGVMPYQSYDENDIKKIASYMYDFKIDEPAWIEKHMEDESHGEVKYNNSGKTAANVSDLNQTASEKGLKYALTTKKELGKNLMGTIQSKGTLAAVEFCNLNAYPITDSMANVQNVVIKRVSDKPRNKDNKASDKELGVIEAFKNSLSKSEKLEPYVEHIEDQVFFYSPIITNSMCLQCHGDITKDIETDVLKTINKLYPNDMATGYDIDQVRGLWRVVFAQ